MSELRLYATQADHPYILSVPTPGRTALLTVVGEDAPRELPADSTPGLLASLQHSVGSTDTITGIHPHPAMARLCCRWMGKHRLRQPRRHFKAIASSSRTLEGKAQITAKTTAWQSENVAIHAFLESISWKQLRQILGVNRWGARLLYRLKTRSLSRFDQTSLRMGCPHAGCASIADCTLTHMFWGCPAAQRLWCLFTNAWQRLGHPVQGGIISTIFHFRVTVPPGIWIHLRDAHPWLGPAVLTSVKERIHTATEQCWRVGILTVLQLIWQWRVAHFDVTKTTNLGAFAARLSIRLLQGYRTVLAKAQRAPLAVRIATEIVVTALQVHQPLAAPMENSSGAVYVLFFDGGSRGNPGPGGSGSVILRVNLAGGSPGTLVWCASMAYGHRKTTNNVAEYRGLLCGLTYALTHQLNPLHVVGDSDMIVSQQRDRRPPKAPHLAHIYQRCRTTADQFTVCTWTHHYRAFNKTADALANLAMDSKRSRQLDARLTRSITTPWTAPLYHVSTDLTEWLAGNMLSTTG